MDLFKLQLLASFIFGGAFVALQSYASEKAPKKYAGLIVSLPSTIVVNFFFLGIVLGPEKFPEILPVVPAPLGFSFVFITSYIYLSKFICKLMGGTKNSKAKKLILIIICSIIGVAIWLCFSLPFAMNAFDSFYKSLAIYFVFVIASQWFLNRPREISPIEEVHYSHMEIIGRAMFAGLMVATTVYLAKVMGPLWGGVMSMFPAAYLSAMVILHYYYHHNKLFLIFANAAIGSISLIVYTFVAVYSFPLYGIWLGTLMSLIASALFSFFLSKITKQ